MLSQQRQTAASSGRLGQSFGIRKKKGRFIQAISKMTRQNKIH